MKKYIMVIIFALMLSFVSTMAFADAVTSGSVGAAITMTDAVGPDLVFTPSPSTFISVWVADTTFTIVSHSGKTDSTNGIDYGILSTNNAMFQRQQTADASTATPASSATALPGSGWTDKAGNSLS